MKQDKTNLNEASKLYKMYFQSSKKHWIAFFTLLSFGIFFLLISGAFCVNGMLHHFFRDFGIALIPIGAMSLIYEYILRENYREVMNESVETVIEERMPQRYKNMRESGIVDVYPNLRIDKLLEDIEKVEDCEIRISDIWMENFNRLHDALIDAVIDRKCRVKIILYNPKHTDPLTSRAKTLGNNTTPTSMISNIIENLRLITSINNKITEAPISSKRGSFEVKLNNSFIAISFIGYGSECLIGLYLRGKLSSMGTQLKVTGDHHFLYQDLNRHFTETWGDSNNEVFDCQKFEELENWFHQYICNSMNNTP